MAVSRWLYVNKYEETLIEMPSVTLTTEPNNAKRSLHRILKH